MDTAQVKQKLDEFDVTLKHLECDGFTRIATYLLNQAKVPHTVYAGRVGTSTKPAIIPVHFWIVLEDGTFVDYRLRMWFGQAAPHGFFKPTCDVFYDGEPIVLNVPSILFNILVTTGAT